MSQTSQNPQFSQGIPRTSYDYQQEQAQQQLPYQYSQYAQQQQQQQGVITPKPLKNIFQEMPRFFAIGSIILGVILLVYSAPRSTNVTQTNGTVVAQNAAVNPRQAWLYVGLACLLLGAVLGFVQWYINWNYTRIVNAWQYTLPRDLIAAEMSADATKTAAGTLAGGLVGSAAVISALR